MSFKILLHTCPVGAEELWDKFSFFFFESDIIADEMEIQEMKKDVFG